MLRLAMVHVGNRAVADDRRRFDRHLAACEGCQVYLEQLRTVIRVAGRPTVDAVPPETMAGLLRAFRDWRR